MPRRPRIVAAGVPHHITQRANNRRDVFVDDTLRKVYLRLIEDQAAKHGLRIDAFCLMTNHVHIVATPCDDLALASTFRHAHGRFAQFWNTVQGQVGHMWQNRYYSCPVDPCALWRVVRYVELNPVRAGMVDRAEQYPWSSARAHVGVTDRPPLEVAAWDWDPEEWHRVLAEESRQPEVDTIRKATYTGRPWGAGAFIERLEHQLGRRVLPSRGGRPRKVADPWPRVRFGTA